MSDMLVNLYDLPKAPTVAEGTRIVRVLPPDFGKVLTFVKTHFDGGWVHECETALHQSPPACFAAVREHAVVGFACYDATARGMFGPVGVDAAVRGQGIGAALTYRCMEAMKEAGYAYAVIGWCDEKQAFYTRTVGAMPIENTGDTVYSRMI
ncbi:MAG: GNAT family N-acetyltransferase [Ruminococcaceae bacterium]|nr:GNAT family N-acetyltransferase [Oscillospiraceae bacterium]